MIVNLKFSAIPTFIVYAKHVTASLGIATGVLLSLFFTLHFCGLSLIIWHRLHEPDSREISDILGDRSNEKISPLNFN